MKNFAALALAVFLAAPHAALAAPSPAHVEAAFGNTVLIVDPDGRSRKIWLQPGGAWTGLSRRGLDLAGKWTVRGDKVCLTQSKPGIPGSLCQALPAKAGVTLQAKDPTGKTVSVKLVKGKVRKSLGQQSR